MIFYIRNLRFTASEVVVVTWDQVGSFDRQQDKVTKERESVYVCVGEKVCMRERKREREREKK